MTLYRVRAPQNEPVAPRESAHPSRNASFDEVFDVVVVGGGCAGLCSALFAAWLGDSVLLLEKAPELGGTTMKSSFWYWVPNNGALQEAGVEDSEEDFLAYCARSSRPERFRPGDPSLGIDPWELELIRAVYRSTWPAAKLLADRGALPYRHLPDVIDYLAQLTEDKTPRGSLSHLGALRPRMNTSNSGSAITLLAERRDAVLVLRQPTEAPKI